MDRFELVEKLVKSTGVGYEDAKTALESSGWDLLDAAVWLEKNGKVENRTQHFTTDPEQQQQAQEAAEQQQRNEAPRGSFSSKTDVRTNGVMHSIFAKIKGILTDNELVICKQSGEVFLELPIWLSVLLLIVAFWPTVGVLVLVFILGFRFRLHGPDLGGNVINSILNQAENAASGFVDRVKGQFSGSQPSVGRESRSDDVIDYQDPQKKE